MNTTFFYFSEYINAPITPLRLSPDELQIIFCLLKQCQLQRLLYYHRLSNGWRCSIAVMIHGTPERPDLALRKAARKRKVIELCQLFETVIISNYCNKAVHVTT